MKLKIYNQSGALKLTAATSSSSTWNNELMAENAVSASFTHFAFVGLDVNDYILLEGIRFSIKKEYKPKQKDRQTYSYSVKFYAPIHDAQQVMYLNLTDGQYEPQFSLDGSPREHLQKWVENMNRIYGEERWQLGDVVDAPNQTIEYGNTTCWDAIAKIAEAFSTEWWSDGFYINLCRCELGERVSLGYMQGLTSLTQAENSDDVAFFTRLIPLGSTKNIDRSRYGFTRLQLPDRAKYIDRNTQYGLYEHVESDAFAGIYPHYTGTVSEVRTEEKTGEDKKPFTVYYFKDSGMAFDPCENEIAGLVKHVSFQTGDLAGRDFEANYDSKTKEWEIINLYPDDDTQIPGGNLIPVVGDTYIPWNFRMPAEYEAQAELDYEAAVSTFLEKYSEDISKYGGDTDYTYIIRNAVPLVLGQSVRLLSEKYFPGTGWRDTRMTKVVRKLDNLSMATIECTNQVGKGWKKSVDDSLNSLQYVVGETLDRAVIDVLKTWDGREPSEYNVFSGKRTLKEITERAISKLGPDETKHLVKFLGGLVADDIRSVNFSSGPLGAGLLIKIDPVTGKSYIEVDELFVRIKAMFSELEIKKLSYTGGNYIFSAAGMKCARIEEYDNYWRCFLLVDDGETAVENPFREGDQIRFQEFNVKPGVHENVSNRYYWRLCVGTGIDFIDLSKTDCDAGSDIPLVGDSLVQLGNRTTSSRQNALTLSVYGDDAPSIHQYAGINAYSISGKEVTVISPSGNKFMGDFILKTGVNILTQFQALENLIYTEVSGMRDEIQSKDNYLYNSAFATSTNGWQTTNRVSFFTVGDKFLYFNDNFYSSKKMVSIVTAGKRNVLRIVESGIMQLNADMAGKPGTAGGEVPSKFFISFRCKVFYTGTLTIGFPDQSLYFSERLEPTDDFIQKEYSGTWDGTGNFELSFSGGIYLHSLALTDNAYEDLITRFQTQIEQTNDRISLLATETTTALGEMNSSINVTAGEISAQSKRIDNVNHTINTAGWITSSDGNELYADKTLENGETIVSKINQTAEDIVIEAKHIKLEGLVTANENFKILEDGSIETNNGKFNGEILTTTQRMKVITGNGTIKDGSLILAWGKYYLPEIKDDYSQVVKFAVPLTTRVLRYIEFVAENENVRLAPNGAIMSSVSSLSIQVPAAGEIIGCRINGYSYWLVFNHAFE